jgi:hypothetical protein
MSAFDTLPQAIRHVIADSDYIHDPREFAARIAKGRSPETMLRGLLRWQERAAV